MQIGSWLKKYFQTVSIGKQQNRSSIIVSIAIHLLFILLLIFFSLPSNNDDKESTINIQINKQKDLVQATVISAKDLEILKDLEAKKKADALALQKAAKADRQKALAAQKAAIEAQQRLERAKIKYKKEQARLEKERAEAEKQAKLEAARKKIEQERKRIEEEKRKAEEEAKKAEQIAEMKRQAQAAMEALAKKKAAEAKVLAKRNAELTKTTNKYIALIQQTIRANWIDHGNLSSQLSVKVAISLSPSGRVQNVSIIKSSGNSAYDRQAVLAVEKSSPLPIPTEPELANEFSKITLTLGGNN